MRRHPAVPYVLPFVVFLAVAILLKKVVPEWLVLVISMTAIFAVSTPVLRTKPSRPLLSVLIGVAVFVIWVAPDRLWTSWHHFVFFDNALIGHPTAMTPELSKHNSVFLFFRIAVSALAVPVLEELFWRGWLMRWLIDSHDFKKVALGTYAPAAFWITALLFASEHGSFWDVGLAAGIIYNWWMIRTRNLWDCIVAHAVTNAILAWYVIGAGQWQYWL